jgi:hypothetical protein
MAAVAHQFRGNFFIVEFGWEREAAARRLALLPDSIIDDAATGNSLQAGRKACK